MALNPILRDMLGDQLWSSLDAAQTRLADPTINAYCTAALWYVARAGAVVEGGLTYEACVAALDGLA